MAKKKDETYIELMYKEKMEAEKSNKDTKDDKKKKSLFSSIIRFFGSLKLIFEKSEETELEQSRFERYIGPGLILEAYNDAKKAAALCEKGVEIAAERAATLGRHQEISVELDELKAINLLSEDDTRQLKILLNKLTHISKEKVVLQRQLGGFDESLDFMRRIENEIPSAIKEMEESENMLNLVKTDIGYLTGEKEELEDQKERYEETRTIIYYFTIIMVIIFAGIIFALGVMLFWYNIDIFLAASVTMVMGILLGSIIYILRRKLDYELKYNVLLQMRAVGLLNKKKLHFVHYTNYLNHMYKKFKVKSVENLKETLQEYNYYKHLSGRYKTVKTISYNVHDDIYDFLIKRGIKSNINVDDIGLRIDNITANKKAIQTMTEEKETLDNKLMQLDAAQSEVWGSLIVLSENDITDDKIISKMMQEYVEEMEKIFTLHN